MKVAIYGNIFVEKYIPYIQKLFDALFKSGFHIEIYTPFYEFLNQKITFKDDVNTFLFKDLKGPIDFVFSIGGDGTFLKSTRFVCDSGTPIIGINTGRLGFLSGITIDEIDSAIKALKSNKYTLDKRILLRFDTENNPFGNNNFALNEIAITKQDTTSMINIHTYINNEFLNSYWADGLIVSTATGSTAYSMSCGGPIVMPRTGVFIITPVAPHNLNVRPIIVPDDSDIRLTAETRSDQVLVALDSMSKSLNPDTEFIIRKNHFNINLVRLETHNYLGTIRTKLSWGIDKRNK